MKKQLITLIFIIFSTLSFAQDAVTSKDGLNFDKDTTIRKAFNSFKPDLKIIGESTTKWDNNYVNEVSHDVLKLAEFNYIKAIDVILLDLEKEPMQIATYYVNVKKQPSDETEEIDMEWPNIKDSKLAVVLHYNSLWHSLTYEQKIEFMKKNDFKIAWEPSNIDLD